MWWWRRRNKCHDRRICCSQFLSCLENQGQAGLSIVPVTNSEHEISRRRFRIELWMIPKAELGTATFPFIPEDRRKVLSTDCAVRYCPFCGRNLLWHYRFIFDSLPGLTIE